MSARIISLYYQADLDLKSEDIVVLNPVGVQQAGRFSLFKTVWQLRKITQNSVIIHTFNNIFIFSALLNFSSLKRTVYTEHSSFDAVRPHVRFMLNCLVGFCSSLVCQTDYSRKKYSRVHRKNLVKIPPSYVEIDRNLPLTKESGLQIAFVGRLEQSKGVNDFIKVSETLISLNPDIRVHIFGEGSFVAEVDAFCSSSRAKGRATYHGFKNTWYETVRGLDFLFILSSSESFSIVGIEAAAQGAALVMYNDLIGPKDYTTEETSIEISRDLSYASIERLHQQMVSLRSNPICANRCAQSVQSYNKDAFQNDWSAIVRDV
ncbi:glycosyltransferase [Shimia sp. MMG029]|nr:glycosyltransferase [Shimia sp. MMG029]MDA5556950.1 glycosyltransferase [Shimia sp. MMG029]